MLMIMVGVLLNIWPKHNALVKHGWLISFMAKTLKVKACQTWLTISFMAFNGCFWTHPNLLYWEKDGKCTI